MLNKKAHKVFNLTYHLILVVKYRKKVLSNNDIIESLKDKVISISSDFNVKVISQGVDEDHIHILFESEPTLDMTKYINILKGHSSRHLRKEYNDFLKDKLWGDSFWSSSYYLTTSGNVSLSKLIKYVENQEKS